MTEIVKVPFHGSVIYTVLVGSAPHVVLRPTLEGIGLDYSAQLKKLKTRSWACVAETATHDVSGRRQSMVTVDLDTWAMLLANIDENRVNGAVRPLVIHYQRESAAVLREYWTQGAAAQRAEAPLDELEVARRYVASLEAQKELTSRVAELEPKAAFVERYVEQGDASTFTVVAGQLGVTGPELRQYLVARGVVYRRTVGQRWSNTNRRMEPVYQWLARSQYAAWFVPKDQANAPRMHNGQFRTTLYITPVGKVGIEAMIRRRPILGQGEFDVDVAS